MTTLQTSTSTSVRDKTTGITADVYNSTGRNRLAVDGSIVITSGSPQYYLSNNQMFSCAGIVNMTSSGVDNPLILFRNPSGSGKIIYVVKVSCGIAVANVAAIFKIWGGPTITANGATLTNFQRNLGNTPANGSALTTTIPTISANGNLLAAAETGQNSNSNVFSEDFSLGVQPNNTFLLTGDPLSNNRNSVLTIIWVEVPV